MLRLQQADEILQVYQRYNIEVDDVDDENLLQHFPAVIKFIQDGLDAGGGVLVHWLVPSIWSREFSKLYCTNECSAMGKSRSAAVCIAYLLHRQPKTQTPESALALLREARPLCEPNEGFMEQLKIYHEMGCPDDDITGHPLYNRWLYRREVEESVACGRAPEMSSVLFEDEQPHRPQDADRTTEIKCRKCRYVALCYFHLDLKLNVEGACWQPPNSSFHMNNKPTRNQAQNVPTFSYIP